MTEIKPTLSRIFDAMRTRWVIYDASGPPPYSKNIRILWEREKFEGEDTGEYSWPTDMRKEYERLLNLGEFDGPEESPINIVEIISDENNAWDQKCAYGYRVGHHAVYCHNSRWIYSPRKCCRGEWFADVYGGNPEDYAHEKCPGFKPNPRYKENP